METLAARKSKRYPEPGPLIPEASGRGGRIKGVVIKMHKDKGGGGGGVRKEFQRASRSGSKGPYATAKKKKGRAKSNGAANFEGMKAGGKVRL